MKSGLLARGLGAVGLALLLAACGGKASAGGSAGSGGSAQGGSAGSGGSAQGGNAQGGSPQGGSAGGNAQGGSGGSAQGGSAQGGSAGGTSCAGSVCRGVCCTGTCTAHGCLVTLYKGAKPWNGFAVHAGSVYWGEQHAVVKLPASGGTPVTLASSQYNLTGLAVDASDVYWGSGDTSPGNGSIHKVPLDGGPAFQVTAGMSYPQSIAVDANRVYCYNNAGGGSVVLAAPLAGGPRAVLASSDSFRIRGVAADSSGVYWVEGGAPGKGAVMKLLPGGKQNTLAPLPGFAIALGGQSVYWLDNDAGTVTEVAKSGGPTKTLAKGQSLVNPDYIAADASAVYWATTSTSGGAVMKSAVGGAGPVVLASGHWEVGGLAVDATSVYWMENSSVMKLTPK